MNGALNVLMVTPRYFPYVGGIETHVHEVGLRLAARGVQVTLLTTVADQHRLHLPRKEVIEGIEVIRVRAWPAQGDYYIAPEVATVIAQGNWDLVHCQGCHTFVPPLAMRAAQKAGLPYIVTFHSGGHSSRMRTLVRGMQWSLQRPLYAGAAKLIGVSRFEANYFREILRLPAERFAVIPNGSLPALSPDAIPAARQELIISIGRLERYKGHHRIISALPKIREMRPAARLLILGSGPYEAALRELAQKVGVAEQVEIRSIPASERQKLAEVLGQAAAVTLFSEYEAHPIAVMEALALERPILVADTSGLSEMAEHELVRAIPLGSSADEIACAIVGQMDAPPPSTRVTLPTWESCTETLLPIYQQIAKRTVCVF